MPIFNFSFSRQNPQPLPAFLTRLGPLAPAEIHVPQQLAQLLQSQGQPVPPPETGMLLIDTGASTSGVDTAIIAALGVNPVGRTNLGTAGGPVPASLYPARFVIGAGSAGAININFSQVVGLNLSGQSLGGQKLIGLIGRDILARGILIYNGPAASFTFAVA